jgi:hypothetical protein
VAPATLREQWQRAAARAAVEITFVSLESLSRGCRVPSAPIIVVDEAHHARTPSTQRYQALATLCVGAKVLLLTATPVVNRESDLHALLALFLGARAAELDADSLARVVIRRMPRQADALHATSSLLPRVRQLPPLSVPECPVDIAAAIRTLPPPLPAADGAAALALIQISLAMAWGSSLAALDAALRRRIQRAAALADSLSAGRWPDRRTLAQWVIGDDATQLAMPLLLADPGSTPPPEATIALHAHLNAVRALRTALHPYVDGDSRARATALASLMSEYPQTRVVLFARHAETVLALWRALRGTAGVVAITGTRVRAAQGRWSREEVLRALGPRAKPLRDDDPRVIRLLLTTDLLAEGVELQGMGIIVHGDGAWNPARFEQRTGRIARIGGAHEVLETRFAMPEGADALVRLRERLHHKSRARDRAVRDAWAREQLEARLARWPDVAHAARIACATSVTAGLLALIRDGDALTLVGARRLRGRWRITTAPEQLRHLTACAEGAARPISDHRVREARRVLARWCAGRAARALIGVGAGNDATRAARTEIDAMIAQTALGGRAAIANSGAEALRVVTQSPGIGPGRALRALLRGARDAALAADSDAQREGYLAGLEQLARTIAQRSMPAASAIPETPVAPATRGTPFKPDRPRLVALLLLEPDDLTTVGRDFTPRRATPATAQAPARSAADPESAATR